MMGVEILAVVKSCVFFALAILLARSRQKEPEKLRDETPEFMDQSKLR